jgi:hypothetical protein
MQVMKQRKFADLATFIQSVTHKVKINFRQNISLIADHERQSRILLLASGAWLKGSVRHSERASSQWPEAGGHLKFALQINQTESF